MNSVFIATSLYGCIPNKNGGLNRLHSIPNYENNDMGYIKFMNRIYVVMMERITFETVCGFGIDCPYDNSVFVMSNILQKLSKSYKNDVFWSRKV